MRNLFCLVVGMMAFGVSSCGGGDGGGSVCKQIGAAVCAKACSCREGAECAIGEAGGEVTFPSENDCRGWYVTLGCSMGDAMAYNDAAACLPLVQAATCNGSGATGALSFPTDMACQTP